MTKNKNERVSFVLYQICDGNPDCAKASDECQPQCIESAFSDEKSMIKNKGMLASVSTLGKEMESFK